MTTEPVTAPEVVPAAVPEPVASEAAQEPAEGAAAVTTVTLKSEPLPERSATPGPIRRWGAGVSGAMGLSSEGGFSFKPAIEPISRHLHGLAWGADARLHDRTNRQYAAARSVAGDEGSIAGCDLP